MTSSRPIPLLLALALALPAWGSAASQDSQGQRSPDEGWSGFPRDGTGGRPAASAASDGVDEDWSNPGFEYRARPVVPPPEEPEEEDEDTEVARTYAPPELPNEVSLFGGPALGQGRAAAAASVGFPFLGARLAYGVLPWLDLGAQVESVYGSLTDVRVVARAQLLNAGGFALGVVADGGHAFFVQPAQVERRGLRWLTGRRNWNAAPGLVASFQGQNPRASRLFLDARVSVAFDTEPFQRDPLGGVPAAVQVSWNVPVRLGAEIPFSRWTSILFSFGFDVHTRPDDSTLMPTLTIGLVTSLF